MDLDKTMNIILKLIKLNLLILAGLFLFRQFTDPEYHELSSILSAFALVFVPELLRKFFGTKLSVRMEFTYYIFIFLAVHLGSCMNFYDNVPHFDKAVHFLSGVFSAVVAYYVMVHYNIYSSSKRFRALFIVVFSMALAGFWEFWEYGCDQILGKFLTGEVQHGLDDTMWDMIMAFLGSLLGGFLFVRKHPQKLIAAECIEVLKKVEHPEELPFEISYVPEQRLVTVLPLEVKKVKTKAGKLARGVGSKLSSKHKAESSSKNSKKGKELD